MRNFYKILWNGIMLTDQKIIFDIRKMENLRSNGGSGRLRAEMKNRVCPGATALY